MPMTKTLLLPAALSLLLISTASQAADCKGMSRSKCESAKRCTYVKSYKTKTGSKVAAYCRNKAKSSSSSGSKSK